MSSEAKDQLAEGDDPRDVGPRQSQVPPRWEEATQAEFGRILEYSLNEIYVFYADTHQFLLANRGARENLGYSMSELEGLTPLDIKPKFTRQDFAQLIRPLQTGDRDIIDFETFHRRKDGSYYPVEVRLQLSSFQGAPVFVAAILDTTERKLAEKALRRAHDVLERRVEERTSSLRESEERFDLAVKGTSEGIWDWNISNAEEWWSDQFYSLLGYKEGEIEASFQTFKQLLHAEDTALTLEAVQAHLGKQSPYDVEFRLRTKSGDYRWFRARGQAVWDKTGKPVRMAGSIQDITDRKQSVAALNANEHLLRRLLDVQENERRIVAHDIHDGILQYFQAAHMRLQTSHSAGNADNYESTARDVEALLRKGIAEGRRMMSNVRPMVLDEEGVIDAILHLVNDEEVNGSLIVDFQHDVRFDRLDSKLEGSIFRIVQEALNNVKKHGQTDHAAVELKQQDGTLDIVVRDQGVGFDQNRIAQDSFGIRSICERAHLFGGTAKIESAPGEGTVVRVQLPVQPGI